MSWLRQIRRHNPNLTRNWKDVLPCKFEYKLSAADSVYFCGVALRFFLLFNLFWRTRFKTLPKIHEIDNCMLNLSQIAALLTDKTLRYIIDIRVPGNVISIWIKLKNADISIWIFNITNCYGKGSVEWTPDKGQKRTTICAISSRPSQQETLIWPPLKAFANNLITAN